MALGIRNGGSRKKSWLSAKPSFQRHSTGDQAPRAFGWTTSGKMISYTRAYKKARLNPWAWLERFFG